mmetsp:Transcript_10559/g.17761  ORF Transcript_10559/g.17761 Transcript_10559/m.17761 type:complete len:222 (-) Transcript_10559:617-1282(-)
MLWRWLRRIATIALGWILLLLRGIARWWSTITSGRLLWRISTVTLRRILGLLLWRGLRRIATRTCIRTSTVEWIGRNRRRSSSSSRSSCQCCCSLGLRHQIVEGTEVLRSRSSSGLCRCSLGVRSRNWIGICRRRGRGGKFNERHRGGWGRDTGCSKVGKGRSPLRSSGCWWLQRSYLRKGLRRRSTPTTFVSKGSEASSSSCIGCSRFCHRTSERISRSG